MTFHLSWIPDSAEGVQKSLWMTPYIALDFEFGDIAPQQINEAWVAIMERTSRTPRGLILISEADAARAIERLVQGIM